MCFPPGGHKLLKNHFQAKEAKDKANPIVQQRKAVQHVLMARSKKWGSDRTFQQNGGAGVVGHAWMQCAYTISYSNIIRAQLNQLCPLFIIM